MLVDVLIVGRLGLRRFTSAATGVVMAVVAARAVALALRLRLRSNSVPSATAAAVAPSAFAVAVSFALVGLLVERGVTARGPPDLFATDAFFAECEGGGVRGDELRRPPSSEPLRRGARALVVDADGEAGPEEWLLFRLLVVSVKGTWYTTGSIACSATVGREGGGGEDTSILAAAAAVSLACEGRTGVDRLELSSADDVRCTAAALVSRCAGSVDGAQLLCSAVTGGRGGLRTCAAPCLLVGDIAEAPSGSEILRGSAGVRTGVEPGVVSPLRTSCDDCDDCEDPRSSKST